MHANVIGSVCCVLLTTLALEPLQPVQIPGPEADIDWQCWSFVITAAAYVTVSLWLCQCQTVSTVTLTQFLMILMSLTVTDSDWLPAHCTLHYTSQSQSLHTHTYTTHFIAPPTAHHYTITHSSHVHCTEASWQIHWMTGRHHGDLDGCCWWLLTSSLSSPAQSNTGHRVTVTPKLQNRCSKMHCIGTEWNKT